MGNLKKDRSYSVLFLGNSYTFFNELWEMFRKAMAGAGYTVSVDQVTSGGYFLDQFLDVNDPSGAVAQEKLSNNRYDFVFLQEQSSCPVLDYPRFEKGAAALCQQIQKTGAGCILYQTWGRKPGSPDLEQFHLTHESMTEGLKLAYQKVGAKVNAAVSPVGTAFHRILVSHPELELYDPDLTHPSALGTYLAALCHFATLTGEDASSAGLGCQCTREQELLLKQAANEAVFGSK